jgi:acyl-CoA synthetase (AMP-forming)/AMP-acid ligase II
MWGATPVAEEVARTVTRRTGVRWLPAYGTSEVPVITANPVQDPERWRLDSAGLAAPGVELRIADPETGAVLDAGATGEIQVLSPSAMAGYLPGAETAAAFIDGWYRTGDIGWMEADGWLHITDRLKEMIKVRGFQVAPAEIEAVLHADPRVRDCAVFGVDDAELGEAIVAAVAVDPGAVVAPEELQDAVAATLAGYKRIRHVVVVDEIPRLPSGKALRRQLKEQWTSGALRSS